ncbi:MAG: regulatory protein RecX [Proteobacteria bacterium]|nr:regulatory protein RecX [Pseudomonadota bacterium]
MTTVSEKYCDSAKARKKAMDYLARREHGRVELLDKVTAAGFGADVAEDAIAQLTAEGLQSDRRFVEAFIRSRIDQGKGPTRIRADLGQRGIVENLIDDGLTDVQQNWHDLARGVRQKKFGASWPADFETKARQMRFLQYRGFEPDHIQAAVSAFGE